ncbi:1-deoxy-D-xylulose-5-phosphate synthase [compost metagenome]
MRREGHARAGQRVAFLAFGSMLHPALGAAEALDASVANMRFVKPLDVELVKSLAANHDYLVTVEEGSTMGGAGSAVLEALAEAGIDIPVLVLGLPDKFIDHGDPAFLLSQCGLDAAGIERSVRERFAIAEAPVKVATPRVA